MDALTKRGINTLVDTEETRRLKKVDMEKIAQGKYSILYVSPEKLLESPDWQKLQKNPKFRKRIVFFAIDEAHCVETWGQTFRKAWGELGLLRSFYHEVPIMALSATFSPKVLQTVKKVLKIIDGRHTMICQPLN